MTWRNTNAHKWHVTEFQGFLCSYFLIQHWILFTSYNPYWKPVGMDINLSTVRKPEFVILIFPNSILGEFTSWELNLQSQDILWLLSLHENV